MELDYLENVNGLNENVVRLYNFNKEEAQKLSELIEDVIINKKQRLDLSTVDFIKPRNCNLILGLFKSDEGILTEDYKTFYCVLTLRSFIKMLNLMEPFCKKETRSYQYLYDVDNPTDFLFSPTASW
ncbi:hypothetical protein F7018_00120 [Tenacibaculum aiptasiae]|uniref:Uncharacterized protein n=1 Tax=Tenacibaculum aiptasiae TaxID=426481 RepID=A0A7J5ARR3_9FLAO|nr:hypothetical protein [Tenacibaculum aiptasiae]KAB1160317.1 hypothetical protein F7018_00120 [Tenacibaculum aiptasiae]